MPISHLFFRFSGRINRAKWWLAALVYFIVNIFLALLIAASYGTSFSDALGAPTLIFDDVRLGVVVYDIAQIVAFISQISVSVKRLHDRNKSGWRLLIFFGIPSVISLIYYNAEPYGSMPTFLLLAALGVFIWAFVELGCLRGTEGENQYGSDPLPPPYFGGPSRQDDEPQPPYPGAPYP